MLASLSILQAVLFMGGVEACGLEPPEQAALATPVQLKTASPPKFDPTLAFLRRDGALGTEGALSGKTVYLSAGHGLVWTGSAWSTQRGNTNGIVEDLVSIEAVDQYLIPYLHAMGAYVVTVREADLGTLRVIVDDPEATVDGSIDELSAGSGWAPVDLPITSDAVAPFESGSSRIFAAGPEHTGGLLYEASLSEPGDYAVYVSFVQGDDRASDAHYVVRHSGGESHVRIDQRRHGSTWVLLGHYHFGTEGAAVEVRNDSADAGTVISSDAVRFGGGMAVHDRGGGDNERPLYEQAARYYAQWNGAPPSVFAAFADDGTADVGTRSRFTAWEHEAGEDAVYVAWHSNAPNPRVGTSSYTYSGSAPPGPLSAFSGVVGSRELQDFIHGEIIDDLRAAWDPRWADEGRFTAYFGEVNPSHNPETPAVLIEVAYHDTPSDAASLRDPDFRRVVARSIAQGIARYFADADGTPLVLPPEPPTSLRVTQSDGGGLVVAWEPPAETPGDGGPAQAWLVQVSKDGLGFDDGIATKQSQLELDGLEPGDVRFVRIVGTNAGGRSLPSQAVGAAVAASGIASVLVVGGFDRLDGGLLIPEDLSTLGLATVDRMWLHRMNDGRYAGRHGLAIADAGFSFDGCTDDVVDEGSVALSDYQAVDWFAGRDSVGDDPVSALARDAIETYLSGDGRLLLAGTEVGWTLGEFGTADDQAFLERIGVRFLLDDAQTFAVAGEQSSIYQGLAFDFDDPAVYLPRFPDVFEPTDDAELALAYQGGTGIGAGVVYAHADASGRGVTLGFPFETIEGATVRAEFMARTLEFFEVQELDVPDPGGGSTGGSSGDDSGSTAESTTADTATSEDATTIALPDTDTDTAEPTQSGDEGCGCRSTSGSTWALGWLALGLLARRRRANPLTRTINSVGRRASRPARRTSPGDSNRESARMRHNRGIRRPDPAIVSRCGTFKEPGRRTRS